LGQGEVAGNQHYHGWRGFHGFNFQWHFQCPSSIIYIYRSIPMVGGASIVFMALISLLKSASFHNKRGYSRASVARHGNVAATTDHLISTTWRCVPTTTLAHRLLQLHTNYHTSTPTTTLAYQLPQFHPNYHTCTQLPHLHTNYHTCVPTTTLAYRRPQLRTKKKHKNKFLGRSKAITLLYCGNCASNFEIRSYCHDFIRFRFFHSFSVLSIT
jgi:hypothetical protein